MTNTCIELSTPLDSETAGSLARLSDLFQERNIGYFLLGATARDIIFHHYAGCDVSPRRTLDIDISVQMDSWKSYDIIRQCMLQDGYVCHDEENHPERLADEVNQMRIDLLPFGEISDDGKSIIWPVDSSKWSIVGFDEACQNALPTEVALAKVNIVTPAAMIYLKMIAVYDRPEDRRKKDSLDIHYILQNYQRVATKLNEWAKTRYQQTLKKTEGDLILASAFVAGQDIGQMVVEDTRSRILEILQIETTSGSRCEIAHELRDELGGEFARARKVLTMLMKGMQDS